MNPLQISLHNPKDYNTKIIRQRLYCIFLIISCSFLVLILRIVDITVIGIDSIKPQSTLNLKNIQNNHKININSVITHDITKDNNPNINLRDFDSYNTSNYINDKEEPSNDLNNYLNDFDDEDYDDYDNDVEHHDKNVFDISNNQHIHLQSKLKNKIFNLKTKTNKTKINNLKSNITNISTTQFPVKRKNILDRNGIILATNVPTASLYAHPKHVIDIHIAAKSISETLGTLSYNEVITRLRSKKNFIWLKRHLSPEEQQKVLNLGIPGIYFTKDERRFYPHSNTTSHVIGYVDIDNIGISGVEKTMDDHLAHEEIVLSIDLRAQHIVRDELNKSITMHNAVSAAGLIMDVNNGEVIAMVSLPDFNPHILNQKSKDAMFNHATLAVREMGSTFKILTLAMALDLDKINVNDAFDVSKPIKLGRFSIHDYKGKGGFLSVAEIFMYSSNLGVAQIAQRVGINSQIEYLKRIGMLSAIKFDLPEMAKPIYPSAKHWNDTSLVTISYGHGIAVSPLHTAQAFAAIVNGGIMYKPTLIMRNHIDTESSIDYNDNYVNGSNNSNDNKNDNNHVYGKRIIKEKTSHLMRKLLRLCVTKGFGKNAEVKGYFVGGKTGTSERVVNGKYQKNLNSALFVGAFPIHKPQYLVFLSIDEPKPNQINHGYTTGGMIAAPVAKAIIKRFGQIMNIQNKDGDVVIEDALFVNYRPRYNPNNQLFAQR